MYWQSKKGQIRLNFSIWSNVNFWANIKKASKSICIRMLCQPVQCWKKKKNRQNWFVRLYESKQSFCLADWKKNLRLSSPPLPTSSKNLRFFPSQFYTSTIISLAHVYTQTPKMYLCPFFPSFIQVDKIAAKQLYITL